MVSIFYFAYRSTKIPSPNTAFQAQTTKVYYAGGKTKIGTVRHPEPGVDPARRDPAGDAGRRRRRRGPHLLDQQGHRPQGHPARRVLQRQGRRTTQGASTITQQYVKILYLTQERTFKRKIKEAFLSLKIQQQQSKSQILEGYLNTIYFGRGAYGVQAAANAYFGGPPRSSTPRSRRCSRRC